MLPQSREFQSLVPKVEKSNLPLGQADDFSKELLSRGDESKADTHSLQKDGSLVSVILLEVRPGVSIDDDDDETGDSKLRATLRGSIAKHEANVDRLRSEVDRAEASINKIEYTNAMIANARIAATKEQKRRSKFRRFFTKRGDNLSAGDAKFEEKTVRSKFRRFFTSQPERDAQDAKLYVPLPAYKDYLQDTKKSLADTETALEMSKKMLHHFEQHPLSW